jgi:methionyl-tRNA formyltransferase
VDTLYDRIWESSEALVPRLLEDLDNRTVPRKPQDMSEYFYNYEIGEQDYELDFRQPAEVLFGRVKMMPGKFYFVFQGEKFFVNDCSIQNEPGVTRRFTLRAPYLLNEKLVFATPRKFLQIESILSNGEEVEPLSLTAKGHIRSIKVNV